MNTIRPVITGLPAGTEEKLHEQIAAMPEDLSAVIRGPSADDTAISVRIWNAKIDQTRKAHPEDFATDRDPSFSAVVDCMRAILVDAGLLF